MRQVKAFLQKLVTGIIALLIFNYSIDTTDAVARPRTSMQPTGCTEDLSYNDIESVYELVTECWIGIEDHVPENDDDDNTTKTGKQSTHWLASYCHPVTIYTAPAAIQRSATLCATPMQGHTGYETPPPDRLA